MNYQPRNVTELISAINSANQAGGTHTIVLQTSLMYLLTQSQPTNGAGLPTITSNITIQGNGAAIRRDANAPHFRIFRIGATGKLTLKGVQISHGQRSSGENTGGAIINLGELILESCIVANNTIAAGGYGGAIINDSTASLTMTKCIVRDNWGSNGGAIFGGKKIDISDTVFFNNQGSTAGCIYSGGDLSITNSRFYNNSSTDGAAIRFDDGEALITDSDFYNNDGAPVIAVAGNGAADVVVNHCRIFNNLTSAVGYITTPAAGKTIDARYNWWGASDGPSVGGSGSGDVIGTSVDYSPFLETDACLHQGNVACDLGYATDDPATSGNPISLRLGEKRLDVTDLNVNSLSEALSFTRSYRQSQQTNPDFQFMGLGWTHNHLYTLNITGTSPNRVAEVQTPNGGMLYLVETSLDHFTALAGSNAWIDYNSGSYNLVGQDKSSTFFEWNGLSNQFEVQVRALSNGAALGYTYDNGYLSEIVDSYNNKMVFTYYAGLTGDDAYKNGQLWRVGDHTAEDLDTATPSGRYIEFDYTPEKVDGIRLTAPKALLLSIQDVRGHVWSYDYYGQNSGETDTDLQNFMTKRLSPAVDTTGDGTADAPILLESLTYQLDSSGTVQQIEQARGDGLLETTFNFHVDGEELTTETVAGEVATHYFDRGLYAGREDSNEQRSLQQPNSMFRVNRQVDANGNSTWLDWSADGSTLNKVANALGQETTFTYDVFRRVTSSIDAKGRKTEYTYGFTPSRQPTRIKVIDADGTTVLRWQEFTLATSTEITEERLLDPTDGITILQKTTRLYSNGLVFSETRHDPISSANDISTSYTHDSLGRVVKVQRSSLFGTCEFSYTVYDSADNVVTTVCGPDNVYQPESVSEAVAMYTNNPQNRVTVYQYDELGRRVATTTNAGASYAQTTLTVYDGLNRIVRTISNYMPDVNVTHPYTGARGDFNHGVNNDQNLIEDREYDARGLLINQTDVSGHVTHYTYDAAGRLIQTLQGQLPEGDVLSQYEYDAVGNQVKSEDPLGRVTYTIYDALNRPKRVVRNASTLIDLDEPVNPAYTDDPRSQNYVPSPKPDHDLIEETEYDASGRIVRTRRLRMSRTVLVWDGNNWQFTPEQDWDYTLYGYNGLGQQVKVIRSASQPDYNLVADPDLSDYVPSSEPDQDLITHSMYDSQGRAYHTSDVLDAATLQGYDGLGRQVKAIQSASNPTYNAASDPDLSGYSAVSDPDQDLISLTYYDADGRVYRTDDMLGRSTLYGYDTQGRQVKVIRNVSNPTYNTAADPDLNAYTPVTASDQDIISETVYDVQGRVFQTFDTHGNETRYEYDALGRRIQTIVNYGDGVYDPNEPDEDLISTNIFDLAGRVISTTDPAGIITRFFYDELGHRIRTIANYVAQGASDPAEWVWNTDEDRWQQYNDTPIDHGTDFDQNLISDTSYNHGSQVIATRDARGTMTEFTYDAAGRRLTVTQAAGTPLATTSYTCYDKAGRVLRTITNWIPTYDENDEPISPDAWDENGNWLFEPDQHGAYADQNIITEFQYDRAGRRTHAIDPVGNVTLTTYFKDGQVKSVVDAEGAETQYRYDKLRRRTRIVQGFSANGEDPEAWLWDATDTRWEESDDTTIVHGTDSDQNILVDVTYDKGGRMLSLRDPRGNLTEYEYDLLDRRTSLTNPLNKTWETAYDNLMGGGTRTTLTDPNGVSTQRDTDRLGRLASIAYGDPTTTPDVRFSYNAAGVRTRMTEYGSASFTDPVRETLYTYDDQRRLTTVGFDTDADTTVDETVSYEYDASGRRTRLTMPGSLEITYTYDAKGQLVSLSDWDDQITRFAYDNTGRHIATERANGLRSRYAYDAAGRLRSLRHTAPSRTLAHFAYEVNGRGNRTQALELLAHPATTTDTVIAYDADTVEYVGTWTEDAVNGFMQTDGIAASLKLMFFGSKADLTISTDSDHSLFDIYIGKTLWRSIDGYTPTPDTRIISIELDSDGPHLLELRNRPEKNLQSSGYTLRFKELIALNISYDLHTIDYTYDGLSRLLTADYRAGSNLTATPFNQYIYAYDVAGNLVNMDGVTRTYNAANQLTNDGTNALTYDHNGNLTDDGPNTYTWDRANRLLSMGGVSSAYDGSGNRIQQTLGTDITRYLLDVQPGLAVVLSATTGTDTTRYVHGPRGIHMQQNDNGDWRWLLQDGLGSVRGVVDDTLAMQQSRLYTPYGALDSSVGTNQTVYGFTGEPTDTNNLLYLRARYYAQSLGVFTAQDLLENVNRYRYTSGNPINRVDRNGLQDTTDCGFIIGLDGVAIWVCSGDGVQLPPIDLSPDQIIIPTPIDQVTATTQGQTETEQQRRERCQRNPTSADCIDYWNEQEPPKVCGCATNWHPASTRPFRDAADLACNLNCYNGAHNVWLYLLALVRDMSEAELHPPVSSGNTGHGSFSQYGRPGVTNRGGLIRLRQPGSHSGHWRSRALVLATFVEEIHHAAHYHDFLTILGVPPCERITYGETEAHAKLAKGTWAVFNIITGDIPAFAFYGVVADEMNNMEGVLDVYGRDLGRRNLTLTDRAFSTCPSSGSYTLAKINLPGMECLDQKVLKHII